MTSISSDARAYHLRQYEKPYDSTIALDRFIREHVPDRQGVFMDVGCGAGAALRYFTDSQLTEWCACVGVDHDPELLEIAAERNKSASFVCLDFTDPLPQADYTTSVQVLSFIEDWRPALSSLLLATRRWAFITSLFWRGVGAHIHASDEEKDGAHYNVIELGEFERACVAAGARQFVARPFVAPHALHGRPDRLQSRTEGLLTLSGPLHLPWWMIAVGMEAGT